MPAEILALSDDEETLNQKDLQWMKKNMPPEKLCEETQFKQPKKTINRKQKRRRKRSCERENENGQQTKRSKKANLPRVEQARIPDAAASHQPVQQDVQQLRPLYQSTPLSKYRCNFRSDRFGNNLPEQSSVTAKLDQILRNQKVMISTISQLILWIRAQRASKEKM